MRPVMAGLAVLVLISLYFVGQGMSMHRQVSVAEEEYHTLLQEYYSLDKETRESAEAGSVLNNQRVKIEQYPSELSRLREVGNGKILAGAYVALVCILVTLVMHHVHIKTKQR